MTASSSRPQVQAPHPARSASLFGQGRFNGFLVVHNGFSYFSPRGKNISPIVFSVSVVRVEFNGLAELCDGFGDFSLQDEQGAEIVAGHPTIRIFRQRVAPEGFLVPVNPRLLPGQYAKCQQQGPTTCQFEKRFGFECDGDSRRHERNQADARDILIMVRHKRKKKRVKHDETEQWT